MILTEQLRRFLEKHGYSVEVFAHGEPCLAQLNGGVLPDLILMDINLGKDRLNGPDVTEKIHAKYDIPVVLHSAYTDKATLDMTKDMTKYGYIQKVPGNEQFVLATIDMALKLYSTEKELRTSEEFHRKTLSNISDTVLLTDEEGNLIYVCPNVDVIFGYSPGEVLAFANIESFAGNLQISNEELYRHEEIRNIKQRISDKQGYTHVLLSNVKRISIGGAARLLYTFHDITELSEKEEALKRSEQMYRDLSKHLQNIREEQNEELSREIHDELGQSLTALKMNLTYVDQSLSQNTVNTDALRETVYDMERIVEGTVKKVRKISTELRPSVIDTEGIMEALRWQVEEFEKVFNIKVQLALPYDEVNLGKQSSLHVFRIVQESLTNCVRHSGASEIHVSANIDDQCFTIAIEDNGYGFETDSTDQDSGFGIMGMKERAKQCEGTVYIRSVPGKGTRVQIEIPISKQSKHRMLQ